jgi:hypothetical protein
MTVGDVNMTLRYLNVKVTDIPGALPAVGEKGMFEKCRETVGVWLKNVKGTAKDNRGVDRKAPTIDEYLNYVNDQANKGGLSRKQIDQCLFTYKVLVPTQKLEQVIRAVEDASNKVKVDTQVIQDATKITADADTKSKENAKKLEDANKALAAAEAKIVSMKDAAAKLMSADASEVDKTMRLIEENKRIAAEAKFEADKNRRLMEENKIIAAEAERLRKETETRLAVDKQRLEDAYKLSADNTAKEAVKRLEESAKRREDVKEQEKTQVFNDAKSKLEEISKRMGYDDFSKFIEHEISEYSPESQAEINSLENKDKHILLFNNIIDYVGSKLEDVSQGEAQKWFFESNAGKEDLQTYKNNLYNKVKANFELAASDVLFSGEQQKKLRDFWTYYHSVSGCSDVKGAPVESVKCERTWREWATFGLVTAAGIAAGVVLANTNLNLLKPSNEVVLYRGPGLPEPMSTAVSTQVILPQIGAPMSTALSTDVNFPQLQAPMSTALSTDVNFPQLQAPMSNLVSTQVNLPIIAPPPSTAVSTYLGREIAFNPRSPWEMEVPSDVIAGDINRGFSPYSLRV